ncbi:MAG TPA: tetratricopeptide repeat protein, partial [Tepidisphaeraceae bacterium]|nr:tetratricopeptide repeat protein [Tepidisphaeraceae bacterium]
DAILSTIENDLSRIASMGNGDDPQILKLRGKVQMLRNNPVEAIQSFERARTLLGQNVDVDLLANLGQAYIVTNQPGTAEQLLEQLIPRIRDNALARIQLAQLYLSSGQTDRAAAQLDRIDADKSITPDLALQSARLRVIVLNRLGRLDEAKQHWAKLPEQTRTDRIIKARLAADLGDTADAMRLHQEVLRENPADAEAVGAMVDAYLRQNNRAQADQVVAAALKAKPDDKGFLALQNRLRASTPEELRKWLDETIRQTPDEFLRDLRLAQVAMSGGDFAGADKQLVAAEKIHPDDPRVMDVRLQWFIRQRKFEEAVPLVDRAASANADRMDGLSIRTHFALERGNVASALKWGSQLVGKYGEFASNWLLLGQAQQAAGRPNDAIASFDAALNRQPNSIDAMRYKAACYESLGQFADEKNLIDAAAKLAPHDANVRDQALNYELHHGDPDKVIASCHDLLKTEPQNAAVYTALAQAYQVAAQTKYRGDAAKARSYFESSRDVLKQGLAKFTNGPEQDRFYPPLAQAYEALGDAAAAEQALRKFADLPSEKGKPAASRNLAMLYERTGRPKDAEPLWRATYDESGKDVPSELDLAMFLIRQHRVDDALATLQANATDPRVINQRIETLISAGRIDEARQIVDQALAANGSDPAAMYYRGVLELAKGDVRAAVDDLTALRNKNPQNNQVRLWLARALLRFGRTGDAIVELQTALQRAPLNEAIRTELIGAYSAANRWADFDRVVKEAEDTPALAVDPKWRQLSAQGLARRGQFKDAIAEINAARKLAPNSLAIWQEQASILTQAGQWQDVLNETDQQLAAGIKTGVLYGQRGAARAGLNDKAGALREFDAGIALEEAAGHPSGVTGLLKMIGQLIGPDDALARLEKFPAGPGRDLIAMDLYGLKHDYAAQAKAAESALSQGDKLSTNQKIVAIRTDAEAYIALSQWDKARNAYDQLIKLQPDDVLILNNVAYLTASLLHDPQAAKQYSSKAYELAMRSGGVPEISDTHGWVLTLCGGSDASTGLGILRNLVNTDKNFTKARYHLAVAYLKSGNVQAASNQLAVVQAQIKELEQNHQPVDGELKTGVPKALEQLQQKSALKGSASSQ